MKTPSETRKPRTKKPSPRSVKLLIRPSAGQPSRLVRITQGDEAAHYWLDFLPSDFGVAFRMMRVGHEATGLEGRDDYDVLIDGPASSCSCPGGIYRCACRHLDAVKALIHAGQLDE